MSFAAPSRATSQKLPSSLAAEQDGEVWYCTAASTCLPAHYHDELEINLIARGSACYRVEGRDYEATAGSELWLYPGAVHDLVSSSPDLAMWVFIVREKLLRTVFDEHPGLLGSALPPANLYPYDPNVFASLSAKGSAIIRHRQTDITNQKLAELLPLAARANQACGQKHSLHPAVNRAVQEIEGHELTLSLSSLASRRHLSEEHLSRLFGHDMGVPLVYYRNHQRVQAFVKAYDAKRDNLLASALDAGFGSYAQFSRAFCQVTAQSPREHFQWLDHKRALRPFVRAHEIAPRSNTRVPCAEGQAARSFMNVARGT